MEILLLIVLVALLGVPPLWPLALLVALWLVWRLVRCGYRAICKFCDEVLKL